MTGMTSNRPYLIRAIYDWLVDNDCTPHVVVDAGVEGVSVPQHYVSNGQIVLNLAPRAVTAFHMDLDAISFNTRFGGMPTDIYIPTEAVLGIYARENGQGMLFSGEEDPEPPPGTDAGSESKKPGRGEKGGKAGSSRPSLKVVK